MHTKIFALNTALINSKLLNEKSIGWSRTNNYYNQLEEFF